MIANTIKGLLDFFLGSLDDAPKWPKCDIDPRRGRCVTFNITDHGDGRWGMEKDWEKTRKCECARKKIKEQMEACEEYFTKHGKHLQD